MWTNRKSSWDTREKIRKKPTLYFSQDELDVLEKMRADERNYGMDSLATTIERIVRKAIAKRKKEKKKK
jgi:hypothetical protein